MLQKVHKFPNHHCDIFVSLVGPDVKLVSLGDEVAGKANIVYVFLFLNT